MEKTIKVTYVGRVISTKNKLVHKYINEDEQSLIFGTKLGNSEVIGSVVECTQKGESTFSGPYKIVGTEENSEKVASWQVEDKLNYQNFQIEKMALKSHGNYYDQNVKELQAIYRKIGYAQRKAFIYNLIQDITK